MVVVRAGLPALVGLRSHSKHDDFGSNMTVKNAIHPLRTMLVKSCCVSSMMEVLNGPKPAVLVLTVQQRPGLDS